MKNKIFKLFFIFGVIFLSSVSCDNTFAANPDGTFCVGKTGQNPCVSTTSISSTYTYADNNGGTITWSYSSSSGITTITLNSYTSASNVQYYRKSKSTNHSVNLVLVGDSVINGDFYTDGALTISGTGSITANNIESYRNITVTSGTFNLSGNLHTGKGNSSQSLNMRDVTSFTGGITAKSSSVTITNTHFINLTSLDVGYSSSSRAKITNSTFDEVGSLGGYSNISGSTFGNIDSISGYISFTESTIGDINTINSSSFSASATDIGNIGSMNTSSSYGTSTISSSHIESIADITMSSGSKLNISSNAEIGSIGNISGRIVMTDSTILGDIGNVSNGLEMTNSHILGDAGDISGRIQLESNSSIKSVGNVINADVIIEDSNIETIGDITATYLALSSANIGSYESLDISNTSYLYLVDAGTFDFPVLDTLNLSDLTIKNTNVNFNSTSVDVYGPITIVNSYVEMSGGNSRLTHNDSGAIVSNSTIYIHDTTSSSSNTEAAIELYSNQNSISGATFKVHNVASPYGLSLSSTDDSLNLGGNTKIDIKGVDIAIMFGMWDITNLNGANISIEDCNLGISAGALSVSSGKINIEAKSSSENIKAGIAAVDSLVITGGDISVDGFKTGASIGYDAVIMGGDLKITNSIENAFEVYSYYPDRTPRITLSSYLEPFFGEEDDYALFDGSEIETYDGESITVYFSTFENSDGQKAKNISFREKAWIGATAYGDMDIEAIIPGEISLEIDSDNIYLTLDSPALQTGSVELEAYTNATKGYDISLNTEGDYNELKPVNPAYTSVIPSISENVTTDSFPSTGWGFSVDEGANFKPIPISTQSVYATAENGVHTHEFTAGARTDFRDTISGEYTNSLVFTATINI